MLFSEQRLSIFLQFLVVKDKHVWFSLDYDFEIMRTLRQSSSLILSCRAAAIPWAQKNYATLFYTTVLVFLVDFKNISPLKTGVNIV